MQIELLPRNVKISDEFRQAVERRLRYALGRFGDRIVSTKVLLNDVNGPKGGVDIQCVIESKLARGGSVAAEVTDVDIELATSRAVERLGRRIRDTLARRRDVARRAGRKQRGAVEAA